MPFQKVVVVATDYYVKYFTLSVSEFYKLVLVGFSMATV